ncbi:DNA-directed RNA polymerase subunit L [Candidatus Bathyarchaeota archaeon]|nr:MAG: DNA-directed RNA polymerase subunit L [Candidatus Bathyarchaeota archaeon]
MELRVLKKTDRELRLEVVGESHTLLNLLQKELVKDPEVEIGGYDVVHPLERPIRSILYVRTRGRKKPEEALLEAVDRARRINREFGELFAKALRSFKGGRA